MDKIIEVMEHLLTSLLGGFPIAPRHSSYLLLCPVGCWTATPATGEG